MVSLRNANFTIIEYALNLEFSDKYSRIWIQYSNYVSRVALCITLFPHNEDYYMVFSRNVLDFSYTKIRSLIK